MVGASGKRYNPTAWDVTQGCKSPLPTEKLGGFDMRYFVDVRYSSGQAAQWSITPHAGETAQQAVERCIKRFAQVGMIVVQWKFVNLEGVL